MERPQLSAPEGDILREALGKLGWRQQMTKVAEELGELQVAILRYLGGEAGVRPELLGELREELADVLIMTEQLGNILSWRHVDVYMRAKIARLGERLKTGHYAHEASDPLGPVMSAAWLEEEKEIEDAGT